MARILCIRKKEKGTYMYAIFTKGKLLFRVHLGVISL